MNGTVCLTQSTTASFTCVVEVVDREILGITDAGWQIYVGRRRYIPVSERSGHTTDENVNGDIITDILTITNVLVDDNGAQYRCQPVIGGVSSDDATLTVLGTYVYLHDYYVQYI